MIQGGNPLAQTGPGFGWLDGVVVDQHFLARNRLPRLLGVLANHPQLAGLGIDESTAAVVGGGQVRVLGTGTVTTITAAKASEPGQQRVWKSGESFELSWLDARMVVAADR
jgi:cyanophycinase-like exopeptidase